jgi:hypothetical protein
MLTNVADHTAKSNGNRGQVEQKDENKRKSSDGEFKSGESTSTPASKRRPLKLKPSHLGTDDLSFRPQKSQQDEEQEQRSIEGRRGVPPTTKDCPIAMDEGLSIALVVKPMKSAPDFKSDDEKAVTLYHAYLHRMIPPLYICQYTKLVGAFQEYSGSTDDAYTPLPPNVQGFSPPTVPSSEENPPRAFKYMMSALMDLKAHSEAHTTKLDRLMSYGAHFIRVKAVDGDYENYVYMDATIRCPAIIGNSKYDPELLDELDDDTLVEHCGCEHEVYEYISKLMGAPSTIGMHIAI